MCFHSSSPKDDDKNKELGDDAEDAETPDLNEELKELEKKLQPPKPKIDKKKATANKKNQRGKK